MRRGVPKAMLWSKRSGDGIVSVSNNLSEWHVSCPHCDGTGRVEDYEGTKKEEKDMARLETSIVGVTAKVLSSHNFNNVQLEATAIVAPGDSWEDVQLDMIDKLSPMATHAARELSKGPLSVPGRSMMTLIEEFITNMAMPQTENVTTVEFPLPVVLAMVLAARSHAGVSTQDLDDVLVKYFASEPVSRDEIEAALHPRPTAAQVEKVFTDATASDIPF